MPDGLRTSLNLLFVPAVVAGLWTLAALRNQQPVTHIGKWRDVDGWRTGDPYALPANRPLALEFGQERQPQPTATPALADAWDVDDEL